MRDDEDVDCLRDVLQAPRAKSPDASAGEGTGGVLGGLGQQKLPGPGLRRHARGDVHSGAPPVSAELDGDPCVEPRMDAREPTLAVQLALNA